LTPSSFEVEVPWKPHAKQRPRFNGGQAYTSTATRNAEKQIRDTFIEVLPFFPNPTGEAVLVHIDLYNDRFVYRQETVADYTQRRLRGDVDNYAKTILDTLNGVAYIDDKQIADLRMRKM
jgi:crossover junction endodeoxyribonuclease RusA